MVPSSGTALQEQQITLVELIEEMVIEKNLINTFESRAAHSDGTQKYSSSKEKCPHSVFKDPRHIPLTLCVHCLPLLFLNSPMAVLLL